MKISQIIVFTGLMTLLLAGLPAAAYGLEDGQFPQFPTVIGDGSQVASPTPQPVIQQVNKAVTPQKDNHAEVEEDVVINETGVFSPWGTVKQAFMKRVHAGEEGTVFALEAVNTRPNGRGELRYRITYANNTDETLRNVSVQVFLPNELKYLDSDLKPDAKRNGAVTFRVGKVASGEEGTINFETRLKKSARETAVRATMTYEDIDGGKHAVTAATTNNFKNGGGLTASTLDSVGGFMLWLLVIVLIAALAFVLYRYLTLLASGRRP